MMQHYELMYILPGSMELEQVPAVKATVAEIVKTAGGTLTVELDMERRRLSYKMGQEAYGYYHLVQFDAEASAIKPLDTKLRLENQVLRFLLVKAKPQSLEQLKDMVAGEKYKKHRPVAATPVVVKVAQTSATALTEAEMEFAKSVSSKHVEEVVAEDKKLSIEDLDKKLDAILEDTDLDKKL